MSSDPPGLGISEGLAHERAGIIHSLRCELTLRIPTAASEPIRGLARMRFQLDAAHRVVLDFANPHNLLSLTRGRDEIEFSIEDGHPTIHASHTHPGANEFAIEFVAGDESLNRHDDFLYSLFVPARAHLAIPCFDQPDLKARYSITLEVPSTWAAVSNAAEFSRDFHRDRAIVRFAETEPLPTYLLAIAAGRFDVESAERNGRTLRMFHRETDASRLAGNRAAIFDLHAHALSWLEAYTGIPYPFGKFDFVVIPSFQFGGMEHPGAILYNASSLMLEATATQDQLLERASLIAHETAHMWFGDLVTMKWFDDVWLKEVFASLMASKIVNPSYPDVNHDLRFFLAHYPGAYDVDRTAGSNPIRQPLANLAEAGALYGPIIYQKAPVVMRQLELSLGPDNFRDGLREYLQRHAFGNATWSDLIAILHNRASEDLARWSRTWVEGRGRPSIPVLPSKASNPLDALMQASDGGLGYGHYELDEAGCRYLVDHLAGVPDALTRGVVWITLWDNMLDGRVTSAQFINLAMTALPREPDEQIASRALAYVARTFWRFLAPAARKATGSSLESFLRAGLGRVHTPRAKATWFGALRDMTVADDGIAWLERVWKRVEVIPGLPLTEADETQLALEIAVRNGHHADNVVADQRARIRDTDRRARFEFVMPAVASDAGERERAFARVTIAANRQHEPWVVEAQRYLNHPLREAHANRFVLPSLELLPEIQRTGDIFFPKRWIDATLAGHRSVEARDTVENFLAHEVGLAERLRWIVLAAADELFRAATTPDQR